MSKFILLYVLLTFLGGCVSPRPVLTREEQRAIRTKKYYNISKDKVFESAEKVLRYADGDDFNILHGENNMSATRNWTVYLVLAAGSGTDYWNLNLIEKGNNYNIFELTVSSNSQAIGAMPTTGGNFAPTTSPSIGTQITGNAIYSLFWDRLDYILGLKKDWVSCEEADEKISNNIHFGSNEALCNSFNIKDDSPISE